MKREYAPRTFLRHVPITLLREFFDHEGLLTDLAWDTLTDQDTEAIYQAWEQLRGEDSQRVETAFRLVHELATDEGIRLLVEEGVVHGVDLVAEFEPLEGLHAKAFWASLHAPEVFHTAGLLYHADHLSTRYWKKRAGMPRKTPDTSPAAVKKLARELSCYFRRHQGRGYNCTVETYVRHGGSYYYFAYPDNYADTYVGHDQATGRLFRP